MGARVGVADTAGRVGRTPSSRDAAGAQRPIASPPPRAKRAAADSAGLGKNADTVSDARRQAKRRRYEMRTELWKLSTLDRVRKCGRVSRLPGGQVGARTARERSGYAGLTTCGSVWACPRCAARI